MTRDPLLSARAITKSFGGIHAVSKVDFDVYPGEILAIIGPNGAGKTTIFNLLTAVHPLDSGEVLFDGRSISRLKPYEITRLHIARTFQNLQIFHNMTVLENVMVGRYSRSHAGLIASALRLPSARRDEAAIRASALDYLARVGLTDRANEPAASLSFGQQRMLELARSLATAPRLLLLDEPGAGLSRGERDELTALIRRLRADGMTVVLVEHDMQMVMEIADRIVVMQYGRTIADGPPDDIQRDQRVIDAYLGYDWDIQMRLQASTVEPDRPKIQADDSKEDLCLQSEA